MARLTLLQTVNRVLVRLKEEEVSTVSERAYSRLIRDLVNQAMFEVEDEAYWRDLRSSVTVSAVSGADTYSLGGWGDRSRIDHVVNETQSKAHVRVKSDRWFDLQTAQSGVPDYYRLRGFDGSGDPQIQLYPSPDASYTLTVYGWVGSEHQTGDSFELLVPSLPVILRAYALAIKERGEDGGLSYGEADQMAKDALYRAIEREGEDQNENWRVA